jgi:hypothetical protein
MNDDWLRDRGSPHHICIERNRGDEPNPFSNSGLMVESVRERAVRRLDIGLSRPGRSPALGIWDVEKAVMASCLRRQQAAVFPSRIGKEPSGLGLRCPFRSRGCASFDSMPLAKDALVLRWRNRKGAVIFLPLPEPNGLMETTPHCVFHVQHPIVILSPSGMVSARCYVPQPTSA